MQEIIQEMEDEMGMPTPPPMDKESAELSEELREPEKDRATEAERQHEVEKDDPYEVREEESDPEA